MAEDRMSTGEERDLLAAEYALGVLDGDALAEAQREAARDPDFAALVEAWNERLAPMLDELPPVEPGSEVWTRIRAAIEEPAKRPVELGAVRRRLNLWKGYSAAVTALAASLLLVIGLRTAEPPAAPAPAPAARQPMMVATLALETGPVSLTAAYDPASNNLVVAPAALSPVAGHDHELWIVPEDGRPRSLGLVRPIGPRRVALPALPLRLVETATIALSAEPAGGSPTGQPTGPIVASGKFSRV